MRHDRFLLAAFVSVLIVQSCNNAGDEKNEAQRILKVSEEGDFRGLNIGDDFKKVWEEEKANIVTSMPDELTCRIPINEQDSTYYDITYNFTEEGLYDIDLEIYPLDSNQSHKLSTDFILYYTERYGAGLRSAGRSEWRVMTANGRIVRISLSDSLKKDDRPFIRINFNEYAR